MSTKNSMDLNDLMQLFEETATVSDINASKYLGTISAAIVKRGTDMNMTQKEFAKYTNVSQGMNSKWE